MLHIQEIQNWGGISETTVGAVWDSVAAKAIVYLCSRVVTYTSNITARIIWGI